MTNPKAPETPKIYLTTKLAGFVVAGRRVPPVYEKDAEGTTSARPKVGHELQLLDREAEYELAQGTIVLKPEPKKKSEQVS